MESEQKSRKMYKTAEICQIINVSKHTLLKWLNSGFIDQPQERTVYEFLWSETNLENIKSYVERRKR